MVGPEHVADGECGFEGALSFFDSEMFVVFARAESEEEVSFVEKVCFCSRGERGVLSLCAGLRGAV